MRYTDDIVEGVRSLYHNHAAWEIADKLGIPVPVVYRVARKYGMKKPKEWILDPRSGGVRKGERRSPATEYKKGGVPHNKGKKTNPETYSKISATFFKPGTRPFNYKPINSISTRADKTGIPYQFIKIRENYWELLHRYVWKKHNGDIPAGMVVTFRDGNAMNCDINNLMLISNRDNMMRNSSINIPEELKEVVKYKNKLIKKIQEHGKKQNK